MPDYILPRRAVLGGAAASVLAAAAPPLPTAPLSLTVMDVAGALALHQPAFEDYRASHPALVSRIAYTKAPAPELAAKVKAQVDAGRSDIDLVLTASDGLSAGLAQDLWQPLLPRFADSFPDLYANYLPAALNLQRAQGGEVGIVCSYYPSGPLLEYLPDAVAAPPATAADLLAWARSHPGRFMYARPTNSGPGRTFMMGLPYLLGDRDPTDPVDGWAKTWAYLEELNRSIEYYPTGTGVTMKELGDGSRDLIVSTTGWDINPRALGIVPKEAKVAVMQGHHWISDANYMVVPRGLPPERLAVVLDVMAHLLQPPMQAFAYDEGYLYPGPAVRNVPLSLAPAASQKVIAEYGRPEYAGLIADYPIELPLKPDRLVLAFRRWDEQIGAKAGRR